MPYGRYGDIEEILKNYEKLEGRLRKFFDYSFLCLLPRQEESFARRRYIDGEKIEVIAAEMEYTPRSMANYRKRILEKLNLFLSIRENEPWVRELLKVTEEARTARIV